MNPAKLNPMRGKIEMALNMMSASLYTEIAPLNAVYAVTQEPVPFSERKNLEYRSIKKGEVWSERVWDCGWFHLTGEVPQGYQNEELFLGIDVEGEGCLFDAEGLPIRGVTNVSSEFERSLGLPGKRFVPFSDGTFPTDPVDVWLETGNNDLLGNAHSGKILMLGIYRCNLPLRELFYDYKFLFSLSNGMDERNPLKMGILYALEKVAINLSSHSDAEKIHSLRAVLKPWLERKGPVQPALTFYAIGHSHLDLAWLWPLRETRRKAGRTFSTALANLAAYPEYTYGASQPQQFEWVKEDYPALFKRIQTAVKEGRFELQGGMWVEADTNITGGESLIRQFYYGKKFWREEFGKETNLLWLPDVFGFSGALPQIMRGCGCENFLTIKLSWNSVNQFPFHSFRWKGIDGSEVLVHMPPEGTYNSSASPKAVFDAAGIYAERGISENAMMLYGIGDGGGGPGREHLEYVRRGKDVCGLPRVIGATAAKFFDALRKERDRLPEYRGEMYLERHQGTYTSQSANKRFNRLVENALCETELAYVLAGKSEPYKKLDAIWKEVLLYQFHDIIPGSSIRRVYEETKPRYEEILKTLRAETRNCLEKAGGKLCALNPTGYFRREYLSKDGVWYEVDAAPFAISEAVITDKKGSCRADGLVIENEKLLAQFSECGVLLRLYDKENGRETVHQGNVLRVYEDTFDAWDTYPGYIDSVPGSFVLTESKTFNEGLRAGIEFIFRYGDSVLTQRVSVAEGSMQLRFDNQIDWRETNKMLRADFYPNMFTDEVTCDIQFGNLRRTMKENNSHEWAQYEICAHKWIDVSEQHYGLALLNDCKYGYRAKNGLLSINLLRSQNHPCTDQDKGIHEFTYALLPHSGNAHDGGVAKAAYALNRPLRMIQSEGTGSPIATDNEHTVIETVKPAYNGDGIVARIYNDTPERQKCLLITDRKCFATDMLETNDTPCDREQIFRPYEIKTFRLI